MCSTRTTTATTTTSTTLTTTTTASTPALRAASPAQVSPTVRGLNRSQASAEKTQDPSSDSRAQRRPTTSPAYVSRSSQSRQSPDELLWSLLGPQSLGLVPGQVSEENLLAMMAVLIDSGARVNARDSTGATPLMLAAKSGNVRVTSFLLDKGANWGHEDKLGNTALFHAVSSGHTDVVRMLVSKGACPGRSSLERRYRQAAEKSGDSNMLKILNAAIEQLEAVDEYGYTPLRRAARQGDADAVRILLGRGAKIDATRDSFIYGEYGEICATFLGPTALLLAAEYGHGQIVKLLIEHGANLEAVDFTAQTALSRAVSKGHADVALLLLNSGANIETTAHTMTPLAWAAIGGHSKTVAILIEAGAKLEAADRSGWTALHWAARNGRTKVTQVLLGQGANINARDRKGKSAIQHAIKKKQHEVVKVLAESGADLKVPTGALLSKVRGWTNPTKEMLTRQADIAYKPLGFDPYQLLRSTLNPIPPQGARSPEQAPNVRQACSDIVSGLCPDQELQELVVLACDEKIPHWYRDHLIKALALAKVCGHYNENNDLGKLPAEAHKAHKTYKAQFEILKENIHRRLQNNLALLTEAAQNDDEFMVRPLIQLGADLHSRDTSSNTAAMVAASHGSFATYAQLLRYGAKADEENFHGFSSLYYVAKAFGNSGNPKGMFQLIRYLGQKDYRFDAPNPASKGPHDAPTLTDLLFRRSENLIPGLILPLLQALISAENQNLLQAIDRHDFVGVKASLEAGAERHARDDAGRPPLEIAQLALDRLRNSSASNLKKEYDAEAILKLLQQVRETL